MSEFVYAGLTSQTIDVFLQDSSSSTGQGLAGLAFNTANLVASYRKGATGSRVAITLATQTVGGAYSSGGFAEIDATHMTGVYRLDLPNGAVDTEGFVTLYLYGATNLLPTALRIDCRAVPADVKKIGADTQSATDLKDFADAGYDPATNKVQGVVLVDTTTTLTTLPSIPTNWLTADGLATDAVSEIQSGLATPTNITQATGITLAPVTHTGATIPTVTTVTNGVTSSTVTDKTGYTLTPTTGLGNQTADITGTVSGNSTHDAAAVLTALGNGSWATEAGGTGDQLTGIPWNAAWDAEVQSEVADALAVFWTSPAALVDLIWDEPTAGHTTAGTYGGRLIRSTNSNVEVQVTGSNHVAADVHEFQTGVIVAGAFAADAITAAALAADAVSEIQSGLATSAAVAAEAVKTANILDGVAWILADATGAIAAPQSATATAILTTFGATYTVQYAGLTSTGARTAPTLSKV